MRGWQAEDDPRLAAISADPEVNRYLGSSTGPFVAPFRAHWRVHGFGLWAVELRDEAHPADLTGCIGFVGLALPTFLAPVAHRPELGWRLARPVWGRGLATEAGVAARNYAFGVLGLPAVISIIHPENRRSQRVAEKLGLEREGEVAHPGLGLAVEIWSRRA